MSGLMDPVKEIERIEKDISVREASLSSIKALFARLPDLQVYKSSKDSEIISCSSQMNGSMTDFIPFHRDTEYLDEYGINTIKVSPKIVDVWLYTELDGLRVYSNPPYFTVGHENESGFGIVQNKEWESLMDSCGVSLALIRKVRTYLKSKPEISW